MAQISLRIDDNVKKNAEKVCEEIGLSMSTAINIFLKKLGTEKRIPFEVSVSDPFYSRSNMLYLEEKMAEYKSGKLKFIENELIEE
ncbi:type II toxin-antitoxin system RelB/DinJ family antitoxin [Campylobacter sp. RM16192]|uniref:type II toxin-antitoxin system RelB/DinJ family antitoxin n=1 Tax=Campylobacter sp. RM16192 TaxID=1660080 RepID=UPI0014525790|nr:type II toxin-antitoxin system RelB/DinJ family antitoxin [Campylobacter sp. RM16192]QCD52230.1 toxin-antitoxin system, antitoxin component, RelB family [Campylobacter sp. RM16192]